jgi:uncharacterized protein (TIGR02217 family)
MGNSVYPTLSGLGWSVIKTPLWSTVVQQSVSGKEVRTALQLFPRYKFQLTYEVLRASAAYPEYQTLIDFFNARQGPYDDFLFADPNDNAVAAQQFGTGDGTTTAFQLLRPLKAGGYLEPVQNLNGTPSIYKAGVLQPSGFTVGATGIVTFGTAPASGAVLTWTGNYYFRCRFVNDSAEFEQFMQDLWRLGKIEFISVKL